MANVLAPAAIAAIAQQAPVFKNLRSAIEDVGEHQSRQRQKRLP